MKIITSFFLLFSCTIFAQKHYTFDYAIEYKRYCKKACDDETFFFLTNSKDNSYFVRLTNKDSLEYKILFIDQNGNSSRTSVFKDSLHLAEYINIPCNNVGKYRNPYKKRVKDYDFENLKDTLIDGEYYSFYKFKYLKGERKKQRKKIGELQYIIQDSTEFHTPILYLATAYEEWLQKKNIPNGIIKEKIHLGYKNDTLYKEKLVRYKRIKKTIVIQDSCNNSH